MSELSKQPQPTRQAKPKPQETSGKLTLFTGFVILWGLCCLCLMLKIYLQAPEQCLPRELKNVTQIEQFLQEEKHASKTVFASIPFYTHKLNQDISENEGTQHFHIDGNSPISVPINKRLINKSDKYTPESVQLLMDYKTALEREQYFTPWNILWIILLFAILISCFGTSLWFMRDGFFTRTSRQFLCNTFVVLHLLCVIIIQYFYTPHSLGTSVLLFTALPTSLIPALSAYLLGMRFGICLSMFLALMTPPFLGGQVPFTIFLHSLFMSFAGVMLFHNVTQRGGFLKGWFYIAAAIILLGFFFAWRIPIDGVWEEWPVFFKTLFSKEETIYPVFWYTLFTLAIGNGFVVFIAMYIFPPVCEKLFDVITPAALSEYCAMNHKLLERLENEAPGTYNHCMLVGQLAGEAAQAIGANKQLAKVCGYFHDIGKLEAPSYFAENLGDRQINPHNDLTPYESSYKIRSHVIEGGKLARKYGLQRPIVEAIVSHHGNDIAGANFYKKACQQAEAAGNPPPEKTEYCYPGPLPKRKEVVLVEIADVSEAATRAQSKIWPQIDEEHIRELINNLIKSKLSNHQFDNADLTLAELGKVTDAIVKALCRSYHERPTYSNQPHQNLIAMLDQPSAIDIKFDSNVESSKSSEATPVPAPASDEKPNATRHRTKTSS